ncbi:MAG: polysaccharide biosynthesis protein [Propionibacteriaceae bacterium]|nr:polysaccharide biosynthesis protein [Propionibacteriaceae bacterium]
MDACSWAVCLFIAAVLRYDFKLVRIDVPPLVILVLGLGVVQFIAGMAAWLYQGRYAVGSLEEIRALGWMLVVETVIIGLLDVFVGINVGLPRSLVFSAAPFTLCLMLCTRLLRRLVNERPQTSVHPRGRRTLIFGAGSLGQITLHRMQLDSRAPYQAVGFLDDDTEKGNLSIRGVRVLGRLEDLPAVAEQIQASVLVVAIADANPTQMARVMSLASPLDIDVKVVPTLDKSFGDRVRVGAIRDVAIEDLIERPPVNLDIPRIASYLSGKRVLVTGAGGSIGKELCVQIKKYGPASLVLLDHDETHLQDTEFALWGTGLLTRPEIVLADIRDYDGLQRVFNEWSPEVVFHAAALKHVPMLQRYPQAAWNTNVLGTLNVLQCARSVGTQVFVNISTDKAANPSTILGHSKRMAERLTSWMGEQTGYDYCSVRFGNVLGSRGSMVPLFQRMIESDIPLTVTHEEATRYFMTIPEACQLVVQAGAIGSAGDVMILDMGDSVRVMDIVNRLIEISGKDCKVQITGLREGEKIHEVLVSTEEEDGVSHPENRIVRAVVPPLPPHDLDYEEWLLLARGGDIVPTDHVDSIDEEIRSMSIPPAQMKASTRV